MRNVMLTEIVMGQLWIDIGEGLEVNELSGYAFLVARLNSRVFKAFLHLFSDPTTHLLFSLSINIANSSCNTFIFITITDIKPYWCYPCVCWSVSLYLMRVFCLLVTSILKSSKANTFMSDLIFQASVKHANLLFDCSHGWEFENLACTPHFVLTKIRSAN